MPSKRFPPILDALTASLGEVFFLQIGANDGFHFDPIEPYVASGKWHGILVEPVPFLFERLTVRYAGRSDLALENCAIASADGTRKFYYVRPVGDATDKWGGGIGSFSLAHVLKHAPMIPDLGKRIEPVQVQCLSLASLLAKHQVNHLDAFIVDAEGFDWEIIQTIPFERVRPILLMYEHAHLKPADDSACTAMLNGQGYHILRRNTNSLGLLESALAGEPKLATEWKRATAENFGEP